MAEQTRWNRLLSRFARRPEPVTDGPTDGAAVAAPLPRAVTLGGRRFVEASEPQNAAQYLYLMRYIRAARLDQSAVLTDPSADALTVGTELLGKVLDSGCLLHVLAGTLVPEGETWTVDIAEASRVHFERLTGRDEIAALQGELVRLLLSFFARGAESPMTSPNSSAPHDPAMTVRIPTSAPAAPSTLATSAP